MSRLFVALVCPTPAQPAPGRQRDFQWCESDDGEIFEELEGDE